MDIPSTAIVAVFKARYGCGRQSHALSRRVYALSSFGLCPHAQAVTPGRENSTSVSTRATEHAAVTIALRTRPLSVRRAIRSDSRHADRLSDTHALGARSAGIFSRRNNQTHSLRLVAPSPSRSTYRATVVGLTSITCSHLPAHLPDHQQLTPSPDPLLTPSCRYLRRLPPSSSERSDGWRYGFVRFAWPRRIGFRVHSTRLLATGFSRVDMSSRLLSSDCWIPSLRRLWQANVTAVARAAPTGGVRTRAIATIVSVDQQLSCSYRPAHNAPLAHLTT
eukprot:550837-Prorocentrum_minimum.AAC.1